MLFTDGRVKAVAKMNGMLRVKSPPGKKVVRDEEDYEQHKQIQGNNN